MKTSQAPDFLPRITAGAEGSTVAGSSFWLDRLRRFGDDDGAFGAKGLSKRVPRLRGVDGGKIGGYSISVYMFFQLRTKRQKNPSKIPTKTPTKSPKDGLQPYFCYHFSKSGCPRRREHDGETALVAASASRPEVVLLLCQWKAEVNAVNRRSADRLGGFPMR